VAVSTRHFSIMYINLSDCSAAMTNVCMPKAPAIACRDMFQPECKHFRWFATVE
jgi:hypothetical protein